MQVDSVSFHLRMFLGRSTTSSNQKMGSPSRSSMLVFVLVNLVIRASSSSSSISFSSSEYEEMGPYTVSLFQTSFPWDHLACAFLEVAADVPASSSYEEPPARSVIAAPSSQSGEYPVVVFKHGTAIANCRYNQILKHIASYGYIVVAPQTAFNPFSSNCNDEIDNTRKVIDWLRGNLALLLASQVSTRTLTPDVGQLFLAGHSRGAKVMFALGLGLSPGVDLAVSSFAGMVALDPVDAAVVFDIPLIIKPEIVTRSTCELRFPILILGTGLGSEGLIPCAPTGYNHQAFFNRTSAPIAYHLVASQYGHLDFLDQPSNFCDRGPDHGKALRPFAAGLALSFMESALSNTTLPMEAILKNWKNASIKLDEPQCRMYQATSICPSMSSTSLLRDEPQCTMYQTNKNGEEAGIKQPAHVHACPAPGF